LGKVPQHILFDPTQPDSCETHVYRTGLLVGNGPLKKVYAKMEAIKVHNKKMPNLCYQIRLTIHETTPEYVLKNQPGTVNEPFLRKQTFPEFLTLKQAIRRLHTFEQEQAPGRPVLTSKKHYMQYTKGVGLDLSPPDTGTPPPQPRP